MSSISPISEQHWSARRPNPRDFPDLYVVSGTRIFEGELEDFDVELRGRAFDIGLDMDEKTALTIAALPNLLRLVQRFTSAEPQTATEAAALKSEAVQLLVEIKAR